MTEDQDQLRAAVIGAGFFGKLHARKLAALPGVRLVAIADHTIGHARDAAAELGVRATADAFELAGEADIVTVATPAVAHAAGAAAMLEAGAAVYVEKPIASTLADADRIVALAEARGLTLQCGHQERFVFRAMGMLDRAIKPLSIECHRAGPWTGRALDVSVALDLMIHDIDLVHQIAPGAITGVEASARARNGSYGDEVTAALTVDGGTRISLFASRIAPERKRFMHVVYPDGEVRIDFLARTMTNTTPEPFVSLFDDGGAAARVATDPLGFAVADFVACVREGRAPLVTGRDARKALATTLAILTAANSPATRDEAYAA